MSPAPLADSVANRFSIRVELPMIVSTSNGLAPDVTAFITPDTITDLAASLGKYLRGREYKGSGTIPHT